MQSSVEEVVPGAAPSLKQRQKVTRKSQPCSSLQGTRPELSKLLSSCKCFVFKSPLPGATGATPWVLGAFCSLGSSRSDTAPCWPLPGARPCGLVGGGGVTASAPRGTALGVRNGYF